MFDFLGPAYLRYSFTRGTDQEVAFLTGRLGLRAGMRLLDVGCGPGRHAQVFATAGIGVVGVDLAARFVEEAQRSGAPGSVFLRGDARHLPVQGGSFDAVISLCQGAFGLVGDDDGLVLGEMARAVRRGGVVAFSAFSAYFAVRFLEPGESFDAAAGVNHEQTVVRNEAGDEREYELATSCFTPRELRLSCAAHGLEVDAVWSVTPGEYAPNPPDLDHPEFLVLARRPH